MWTIHQTSGVIHSSLYAAGEVVVEIVGEVVVEMVREVMVEMVRKVMVH